jgi:uncharacterized protein YndB with AHSA1/START domain
VAIRLSATIRAPIEDVFAFFDDPGRAMEVNPHATRFEVVDVQPDGRRSVDVVMRAGAREWMQSIEQVVREPPTRLVTIGWTWTTDRGAEVMTLSTDRRFRHDGDATHVDVDLEHRLDRPWRHPDWAIVNRLRAGATRREFQRQLDLIAARIEGEFEARAGR